MKSLKESSLQNLRKKEFKREIHWLLLDILVQENDFSIETPIITKDVNYYNITDSHKVPSIKLDSNRFSKFTSNSITPRVYTQLYYKQAEYRSRIVSIVQIQIFPMHHSHRQSSGFVVICFLLNSLM